MRETTKKLSLDVCYSVSLIENQGYQQNSSVAQDGDLSVCIWQISDQDCFWNFGFLKAGFAGDRIGIQVIVRTVRGFSLNHKHQSHKWNWKKMKLPCFFWFWFCSFYNSAYNCDFQFLLHHIIFFQFHLSLTPMIQGKLHHGSYKQKWKWHSIEIPVFHPAENSLLLTTPTIQFSLHFRQQSCTVSNIYIFFWFYWFDFL